MKRFLALFGFVALLASCTSNEKGTDMEFKTVEKLVCDSVAINEILKPSDWFAVEGSRAVVYSPRSEKLFYVYSHPEWEYLYNYGVQGEGPDDYRGAYVSLCDVSKDKFSVSSFSTGGLRERTLRVGEDSIEVVADTVWGKNRSFDYIYRESIVNDSVYVIKYVPVFDEALNQNNPTFKEYLITMYSETDVHIDSLLLAQTIDYKVSEDRTTISGNIYNRAYILYRDSKAYVIYDQLRRMDIYDISPDGKITHDKTIGKPYTWEEVQGMDLKISEGETVFNVVGGDKYIYAMTCQWQDMGSWRKVLNTYVEVWDYDGNKVKKYDMNRNFNRMMVDEKNEYFYFYHSGYDFEWVYRYKYDL